VSKLLDFGLAKAVHESATTSSLFAETGHRETSFTPSYGAPEQWLRRLGATGTWTDVHALALVCVEFLCGRRAFQGDSAQLMASCLDQAVRPTPRALDCEVPDAVEQVFLKALAVDPRERFANAADFWRALQSAAGVVAVPARTPTSLAAVHAAPDPAEVTAPTQSRQLGELASDASEAPVAVPSRRTGGRRAQIIALVSLALLSGLFFLTAPRSAKNPSVRAQPAEPAKPVVVTREPTHRATQPTAPSSFTAYSPTVSTPARPVEAVRKRPVAARAPARPHPKPVSTAVPSSIASDPVAREPTAARADDILRHDELTRRH
jgi:serine/threonine protein kinase